MVKKLRGKRRQQAEQPAHEAEQERLAHERDRARRDRENPRARIVPISRVRELTAENIVLAAANIAPNVSSTAINVPAALRKMLDFDWFSKYVDSGIAASLNWVAVLDRLPEVVAVPGAGRADLDAGDRAVASGVPLDVLQVGPDLALGGAAAGGEDADDAVPLLLAEYEQPADLGSLVEPREVAADDALPLARLKVAAGDDLEVGPELPRGRSGRPG